jgi:hypothetical protein
LVPVTNPLDTVVTVPKASRTALQHLNALLEAVNTATGFPMLSSNSRLNHYYAANSYLLPTFLTDAHRTYMLFEWGASNVTARDTLISLMGSSYTTLSWQLSCGARGWQDKTCSLSVGPLIVGNSRTPVFYDRCTNCVPAPVPEGEPQVSPLRWLS